MTDEISTATMLAIAAGKEQLIQYGRGRTTHLARTLIAFTGFRIWMTYCGCNLVDVTQGCDTSVLVGNFNHTWITPNHGMPFCKACARKERRRKP